MHCVGWFLTALLLLDAAHHLPCCSPSCRCGLATACTGRLPQPRRRAGWLQHDAQRSAAAPSCPTSMNHSVRAIALKLLLLWVGS
jgi:hypothetical protein